MSPDPAVVVLHEVLHAKLYELVSGLKGQKGPIQYILGLGTKHIGEVL